MLCLFWSIRRCSRCLQMLLTSACSVTRRLSPLHLCSLIAADQHTLLQIGWPTDDDTSPLYFTSSEWGHLRTLTAWGTWLKLEAGCTLMWNETVLKPVFSSTLHYCLLLLCYFLSFMVTVIKNKIPMSIHFEINGCVIATDGWNLTLILFILVHIFTQKQNSCN